MTALRGVLRRLRLRVFARRNYWHNRAYDDRFLCLPDAGNPRQGYMIWEKRLVLPVTHASAAYGPQDTQRGCNLIASGPSVLDIPARQRLLERFSVVVNGAHAAVDRGNRRFDLYLVSDVRFIRGKWDLFCAGLDAANAFAADHRVLVEILSRDPRVLIGRRLILFTNLRRPYLGRRDDRPAWRILPGVVVGDSGQAFSHNLALGAFPGDTVVYPALQLLCGWGFRDIHVFGLDLTGGQRSYAEGQPAASLLREQYRDAILPALTLAGAAALRRGCTIWNCSPVSILPEQVFPKLDPEAALGAIRAIAGEAPFAAGNRA